MEPRIQYAQTANTKGEGPLKGFKGICLVAAAMALAAGLPGTQVSAGSPSVSIGSLTVNVGDPGSVELQALNIPEPQGAWDIEILYDPEVVSVVECAPRENSICNPDFTDNSFRVIGASATGLAGDFLLASITLRCESQGSSPLSISLRVWGPAFGFPPPPPGSHDGAITCVEAPEPTVTEEAAPTATLGSSLPETGTGGGSAGGALSRLTAALAGVSLAAIVGFGALRLYEVRWWEA